jgi:hypothetical protein
MKRNWPALDYADWRDTALTLQLWSQIVGKIRLALAPWRNHGWQVPLYVTARGLGSSGIPAGMDMIDIEFDFVDHRLVCRSSNGKVRHVALMAMTVAAFYGEVMEAMTTIGAEVRVNLLPNEVVNPIAFDKDTFHASYDGAAARRFWQAMVQIDRVFGRFQSGFLGKVSPVHFFWGGFDLAVTRFSGRAAPLHPGGVPGLPDKVTQEAYSHEVSSAGFWPGSDAYPQPAFYSYAYPEPAGFRTSPIPAEASFDETLGEFVLPYSAVCSAADPDALLLAFLSATYSAAADLGFWDRAALDCPMGIQGIPRTI